MSGTKHHSLLIMIIVSYVFIFTFFISRYYDRNSEQKPRRYRPSPSVPIILFWSGFYIFKADDWPVKRGIMDCGRQIRCFLSSDKKLYKRSSALIFHHRNPNWVTEVSQLRGEDAGIQNQVFVVYNRESSQWDPKGKDILDRVNGLINWTVGLRRDDDIFIPTAKVMKGRHEDGFDPTRNYLEGKTGFAAALLTSNCFTGEVNRGYFGRAKFIEAIRSAGLKFDTYGNCGKRCGDYKNCANFLKNYKFVLAFENTLCDDYLSEKPFANGLSIGTVPIVASLANITDPYVIPQGSFINALNFSNPTELVSYVKKVGNDPKLYSKFFEWRANWTYQLMSINEGIVPYTDDYFCPLCHKLYELERNPHPKTIRNYTEWYEQEKCHPFPYQ